MCFRLPDVPVTVMAKVPVLARLPTVSVRVLEVLDGFGLKEADTRPGKPDAEKVAEPVKPLRGVIVTVDAPWLPRATFRLVGETARLKFGPGVTVRVTMVELTSPWEFPVTVIGYAAVATAEPTLMVIVLDVAVIAGLNDALAPAGKPDAESATTPLKPFAGLTVIVLVFALPWAMETLVGAALRLKFPMGAAAGQLLTRFVALMVPMPVAKSQPMPAA